MNLASNKSLTKDWNCVFLNVVNSSTRALFCYRILLLSTFWFGCASVCVCVQIWLVRAVTSKWEYKF